MINTPVLFIIFNRPDSTKKVFEAIKQAKPSLLYIAADAPRTGNLNDAANCKAARAITENIDWPCEVKRLYQAKNLGCSFGPRAAFDWFFAQEPEGIILEDDCVPDPSFFTFAATMLERYRDNKKIISINGTNLGYKLTVGKLMVRSNLCCQYLYQLISVSKICWRIFLYRNQTGCFSSRHWVSE